MTAFSHHKDCGKEHEREEYGLDQLAVRKNTEKGYDHNEQQEYQEQCREQCREPRLAVP